MYLPLISFAKSSTIAGGELNATIIACLRCPSKSSLNSVCVIAPNAMCLSAGTDGALLNSSPSGNYACIYMSFNIK